MSFVSYQKVLKVLQALKKEKASVTMENLLQILQSKKQRNQLLANGQIIKERLLFMFMMKNTQVKMKFQILLKVIFESIPSSGYLFITKGMQQYKLLTRMLKKLVNGRLDRTSKHKKALCLLMYAQKTYFRFVIRNAGNKTVT